MRVTKACVFFKIEVYIAVPGTKAPLRCHVILVVQFHHLSFNKGIMMSKISQQAMLAVEERLPVNFLTV